MNKLLVDRLIINNNFILKPKGKPLYLYTK